MNKILFKRSFLNKILFRFFVCCQLRAVQTNCGTKFCSTNQRKSQNPKTHSSICSTKQQTTKFCSGFLFLLNKILFTCFVLLPAEACTDKFWNKYLLNKILFMFLNKILFIGPFWNKQQKFVHCICSGVCSKTLNKQQKNKQQMFVLCCLFRNPEQTTKEQTTNICCLLFVLGPLQTRTNNKQQISRVVYEKTNDPPCFLLPALFRRLLFVLLLFVQGF